MGIDNTTRRMQDPEEKMLLLAESMVTGSPASFIEAQEAAGQRQLVNSDRLPSDFRPGRAEWEALGFTFGDPDPDDPLFMPATLPEGWTRQASDHDMWSHLLDRHGRQRVAVFYKAAFYDRKAFMRLESVESYVIMHVEYGAPKVITNEWATRETVLSAMRGQVAEHRKTAAEFRGYAADTVTRDPGNRERCAEHADEAEARAAKYEAAIAELEAGNGDA